MQTTLARSNSALSPGLHLGAALRVYIPMRLLLSVWAMLCIGLIPVGFYTNFTDLPDYRTVQQNGFVDDWLLDPWLRWDAEWYVRLAEHGYADLMPGATAFAPLYPALVGLVGRAAGGHYLLAALLVSNIMAVLAFTLVHRLVAQRQPAWVADRTLLYLVCFPTSFFLFAPYTESLFLALAAGALLAGQTRRWALAGILGGLAAITRWPGAILFAALGWEYLSGIRAGRPWRQWRTWIAAGGWRQWRAILWLLLIPLVLAGTLAWMQSIAGAASPWQQLESQWQGTFTWPWVALARTQIAWFTTATPSDPIHVFSLVSDWVLTVLFGALLVTSAKITGIGPALYGFGTLLFPASRVTNSLFTQGMSRYILPIFPGFAAAARLSRNHRVHLLSLGIGLLLNLLNAAFFIQWYWAG